MKQVKRSNEELGMLCLSLTNLLHAGIGTGDAFALMARDERRPEPARLLSEMARRADEGAALAQILREAGDFPAYLCSLLEVGERVGKTEQTLASLAEHYQARSRMDRRLRAALLYPCILLVVMLVVVAVLLVRVLPVFNDVYAQLGGTLTGVAGGLLRLGGLLHRGMPVLFGLLTGAVVLLILCAVCPCVGERFLLCWRRLRGDRGVFGQICAARFVQALSLGLSSGMTEQEAVRLALTFGQECPAFRVRCEECLAQVEQGAGLSAALRECGIMSAARCRLLEAGVRSGRGELVMEQLAGQMLEESEQELEVRMGAIEPVLVLVTSALVGMILLSVMLPLAHIMSGIG